ncbi:Protein IMPACT -like protein [Toxocara canis]|uniref:Protein IMPACT-like protein n=2 Tax=Toxocara canis TaxID=6265 RepID=A0A0B2W2P9_TOXCA|nr:Protein IMPACT -like protein [Toxocara canis]VDM46865.1 unnamed protein product [Toxocara canis]
MGDKEAQQDEIQSIEAIFGDLVHLESTSRINVRFEQDVQLTIDLPLDYPSCSPPTFELSGPTLKVAERRDLSNKLQDIYMQNIGEPILYEWIECINRYLAERSNETEPAETSIEEVRSSTDDVIIANVNIPEIVSGDILTDRKSTFQAHLALITSENEALLVLGKLKENSKIARATHNIYAWRTEEDVDGRIIKRHDCEDDGEIGAGPKLLHLLELMKASNVIVIVTRWYGGIHLGPDRFRHICNIAREILVQNGFAKRS